MSEEMTIEVIATTAPPAPGFRFAGRRVQLGEQVRIPVGDADHLARCGKCRVVEGTEKEGRR